MKIKHILRLQEFKDIVNTGEKFAGKTVSLYRKNHPAGKGLAVGVIISKKNAGKAVIRNYVKRSIYSFFQDQKLNPDATVNIVIRLTKNITCLTLREIRNGILTDLSFFTKTSGLSNDKK